MRKLLFLLLLISTATALCAQELHVMTFNIRYNNPADSGNAWPYRKTKAAGQVLFHGVQLLGIQEGLIGQLKDLDSLLPRFKRVGVGRADGKEKGEFSAIYYDTSRLQLLKGATFWLSAHPDSVGKKGWDAAIERIVTWAKFRDRLTNRTFFHFNTHFDHIGPVARRESARLLLQQVKSIAGGAFTIVTGDLNAVPSDEPVRILTDQANPDRLADTKALSEQPHYGPDGTFNGFGPGETGQAPIDYIFIRGKARVLQHATLSQSWQGRFSSDHFPVLAVLKW